MQCQIEICSTEGVTLAGSEVCERHFKPAADFRVYLMHLAGVSVWRKPFRQRIGIEKRAINFFWRRAQDTMQPDRVCRSGFGSSSHYPFFSTNCLSSVPMIAVQPSSKFFRAYAGVFGNVSIPVCVNFSRVLSPSGDNSMVTNESPGSPL